MTLTALPRQITGGPISAGQIKPSEQAWPIFRDLVRAHSAFGLKRQVLTTLRALITFMEKDHIVYASNRSLSERAEAMSHSTLRRHIKALLDAGFVGRSNSPNGKRYKLLCAGEDDIIFGIDLQPLFARAAEITEAAEDCDRKAAALRYHRKVLGMTIYAADLAGMSEESLLPFRRALRQKLSPHAIEAMTAQLKSLFITAEITEEMTVSDSQNDCDMTIPNKKYRKTMPLETELIEKAYEIAPDIIEMSPKPLNHWQEIENFAEVNASWIGLSQLLSDARQRMGRVLTTFAILVTAQRSGQIRNVKAYFKALVKGAEQGRFKPIQVLI